MTVTLATVVAGLITGLGIGGLAAGLVLVFRVSGVINLAHAEVGAAAAAGCAWLVGTARLPFAAAAGVAVVAAGAVGALVERVVVRRVQVGSPAAVMIATAGVGELLLALSLVVIGGIARRGGYPVPFAARLDLGRGVVVSGAAITLAVLVPGLALALGWVLRRTGVGAAVRAAADNPEAARLAGIPVAALSTAVWGTAAALSAVVVICLLAGQPIVGTEALGPEVLFSSLAAALVARFSSLPRAVAAGVALGVIQQVAAYNWPGGVSDLVLLAVAVGAAVVVGRRRSGRLASGSGSGSGSGASGASGASGRWLAVPVLPVPGRPPSSGRHGGWRRRPGVAVIVGGLALFGATVAGVVAASNSQALTLSETAAYATLAISATLIVGVAGQLSLGQVAFFGIGAAASYQLSVSVGLPFWVALLGAGLAAAVASVLVGAPAARAAGPVFAMTSLGFALVASGWLLSRSWLLGSGVIVPRPILGPIDLAAQRPYFVFAMVVLVGATLLAWGLLRHSPGRRMVAVRDNETTAASFAIPVLGTKVMAFAVAGFLAGVAGAVYGHGLQSVSVNDFPVASPGLQIGAVDGLRIVAIAVIGGLGSVWGAVVAAVLVVGVDQLTTSVAWRLATTGAGLLVVLLLAPRGLAGLAAVAASRSRSRRLGDGGRRGDDFDRGPVW